MFTLLWKWLLSMFTADKIGILVRKILISAAKPVISDVLDTKNQKRAYMLVKELNARDDITNETKRKIFNELFFMWARESGKAITESVVNCLRELAVNAVKSEKS